MFARNEVRALWRPMRQQQALRRQTPTSSRANRKPRQRIVRSEREQSGPSSQQGPRLAPRLWTWLVVYPSGLPPSFGCWSIVQLPSSVGLSQMEQLDLRQPLEQLVHRQPRRRLLYNASRGGVRCFTFAVFSP